MTDTWDTLESMPTPRVGFAIAAYDGKIYCVGGTIYDKMERVTFGVNEVYDTVTDSWSTKASLPYKGTNVQANAVDDKIFVIIDGKDLYMYDPVTDLWTKKSDLPETPTGGSLFVSIVVDGKIIVTGDFSVKNPPNVYRYQKVFIYDPKANRWSEGKTGPVVVQFCVAGATSGIYASPKVYVLGLVYDSFSSVNMVNQVYDPVGDVWSSAKALPTNRVDFGVAVVNDILYVIGGYTSNNLATIGGAVNPCVLNEQYIPIGYHSISIPELSVTPEFTLIYLIVITLVIGTAVIGLFFFLKKRQKGCTGDITLFNVVSVYNNDEW